MNSYGVLPKSIQNEDQDICSNIQMWQKRTIFNAKSTMLSYVDDLANYMYELDSVLDELIEFQKTFRKSFTGPNETANETTVQLFVASMEQVGNVILSLQNLHEQIVSLWQPWNSLLGQSKQNDIPVKQTYPSKFDALPLAAQERTEDLRIALESYELGSNANASLTVWNNFTSYCLRRRDELIESFHEVLAKIYCEILQDEAESLFYRVVYSKLLRVQRKKKGGELFEEDLSDEKKQQQQLQKDVTQELSPAILKVLPVDTVNVNSETSLEVFDENSGKSNEKVQAKPSLSPGAQKQYDMITKDNPDFSEQKRRWRKLVLKVHTDQGGDRTEQNNLQTAIAALKVEEPSWGQLAGGFACRIESVQQPHELNKYKYNLFRRVLQNNLPQEDQARCIVLAKNQLLVLFQAQFQSKLSADLRLDIGEFPNSEVVNLTRKYLRPRPSVEPLPKYLVDPDLEKLIQDQIQVFSQNDFEASKISKKTFQKVLQPLTQKEQDEIRLAQKAELPEPSFDSVELELDRGEVRLEAQKDENSSKEVQVQNATENLDIQSLVAKFSAGQGMQTSGLLISAPFESPMVV